jgi:predicted type IV restriction endonuclease
MKRLVDHFDQNRKVFLSSDYKEEQLRAEFLNPLFTALGWNVVMPKDVLGQARE